MIRMQCNALHPNHFLSLILHFINPRMIGSELINDRNMEKR